MTTTAEARTEILAAACYSAWYAYTVLGLGEEGEMWPDAPPFQKNSIRDGIAFWDEKMQFMAEAGAIPEHSDLIAALAPLSHENWLKHKTAEGWVYGEKKDPEAKTHFCMVPYSDLPEAQQKKDAVVIQAYLAVRSTL